MEREVAQPHQRTKLARRHSTSIVPGATKKLRLGKHRPKRGEGAHFVVTGVTCRIRPLRQKYSYLAICCTRSIFFSFDTTVAGLPQKRLDRRDRVPGYAPVSREPHTFCTHGAAWPHGGGWFRPNGSVRSKEAASGIGGEEKVAGGETSGRVSDTYAHLSLCARWSSEVESGPLPRPITGIRHESGEQGLRGL